METHSDEKFVSFIPDICTQQTEDASHADSAKNNGAFAHVSLHNSKIQTGDMSPVHQSEFTKKVMVQIHQWSFQR